jgi:hypothetical protein
MSGLRPHLEHGPETHLVSTNLVGGTFVEVDGVTGKVKPAGAGSVVCLGLALGDAAATAGMQAVTQDAWGRNYGGGLNPPNEVAVAYRGSWWLKNTSGGTLALRCSAHHRCGRQFRCGWCYPRCPNDCGHCH